MATQVFRVDDMNGELIEEDTPPIKFTIEGAAYEIDLTAANRDGFLAAVQPYIEKARSKGGRAKSSAADHSSSVQAPAGAATTGRSINGGPVNPVAIRAWAAENWPEPVADKGRVPAAVVAAYEAAQLAQQIEPAGAATTEEQVPVAPVNPGDIPAPEGIFAVPQDV
jgi:hypothetical protein